MRANLKPSQNVAILDSIAPQSMIAGTYTSGWVAANQALWLAAILQIGTPGSSGTIDAKLQQATSSAGAGAKDLIAMTQQTAAGQVIIQAKTDSLDLANGFGYVRLSVTTAVAATPCSALLLGMSERNGPPDASGGINNASVLSVVG